VQSDIQTRPRIASNAAGQFVVVWDYFSVPTQTYKVMYRLYDGQGNPLSGATALATGMVADTSHFPEVSMNSTGDFVIGWVAHDDGYYVHSFDAFGVQQQALAGSVELEALGSSPSGLRVAMGDLGQIAMVEVTKNVSQPFLKSWDTAGNVTGDSFHIHELGFPTSPDSPGFAIAATQAFNLHAVFPQTSYQGGWKLIHNNLLYPTDLSPCGWGANFGGDNNEECLETDLAASECACKFGNTVTQAPGGVVPRNLHLALASLADGRALVSWTRVGEEDDGDIYFRRIPADGYLEDLGQGAGTLLNFATVGTQQRSAVALSLGYDAIVVWESYGSDADGDVLLRIVPYVE
jgi:hypothetical protein